MNGVALKTQIERLILVRQPALPGAHQCLIGSRRPGAYRPPFVQLSHLAKSAPATTIG